MMIRAALLASLLVLTTSLASADITFTTATSTASGNPITALVVGDVVTIDITLTSDGEETLGVGASAAGYDVATISFVSGDVGPAILNAFCSGPGSCFGGIPNLETSAGLVETSDNVPSEFVRFVTAVTLTPTTGTGALDPGVITAVDGDPQFQLRFTALAEGVTDMTIGSLEAFGDEATGPGAVAIPVANDVITFTVPEPGEVASSLAALGSVFAVIAIRRRF